MSPSHFNRAFKSVFGSTPAEFVENLRVNEANRRLSTPKRTIDTVAASVGFSDAETFRRAFERRLGAKPGSHLYQSRDSNGESRGNSNGSTSKIPRNGTVSVVEKTP